LGVVEMFKNNFGFLCVVGGGGDGETAF